MTNKTQKFAAGFSFFWTVATMLRPVGDDRNWGESATTGQQRYTTLAAKTLVNQAFEQVSSTIA